MLDLEYVASEVTQFPNGFHLPYSKTPHVPIDIFFKPFPLPQKLSMDIKFNKASISDDTFNEFAVFLCNDWTIWDGKEVGWRFPFDCDKVAPYIQHPFRRLWFERRVSEAGVIKKNYSITFHHLFWEIMFITFRIDTLFHYASFMKIPPDSLMKLVLTAHNWSITTEEEYWLEVSNIQIS